MSISSEQTTDQAPVLLNFRRIPAAITQTPGTDTLVRELELRVADLVNRRFALVVPTHREAVHAAIRAVTGKPAPSRYGFVVVPVTASNDVISAVVDQGLETAAADVDPSSLTICTESVRDFCRRSPAAVYLTHTHGRTADIGQLEELRSRYQIQLVEDVGLCSGSQSRGRQAGCLGDISVMRFGSAAAETLSVLLTDDPELFCQLNEDRNRNTWPTCDLEPEWESRIRTRGPDEQRLVNALDELTRLTDEGARLRLLWMQFSRLLAGVPGLRVIDSDVVSGDRPTSLDVLVDRPAVLVDGLHDSRLECSQPFEELPIMTAATPVQLEATVDGSSLDESARRLRHVVSFALSRETTEADVSSLCDRIRSLLSGKR